MMPADMAKGSEIRSKRIEGIPQFIWNYEINYQVNGGGEKNYQEYRLGPAFLQLNSFCPAAALELLIIWGTSASAIRLP
jgi:hypothetical protein